MENKFNPNNLTREQIDAVLACKTAEELVALARENGVEVTEEKAKEYLAEMADIEVSLSDEEARDIAGGDPCGGYCIYNKW